MYGFSPNSSVQRNTLTAPVSVQRLLLKLHSNAFENSSAGWSLTGATCQKIPHRLSLWMTLTKWTLLLSSPSKSFFIHYRERKSNYVFSFQIACSFSGLQQDKCAPIPGPIFCSKLTDLMGYACVGNKWSHQKHLWDGFSSLAVSEKGTEAEELSLLSPCRCPRVLKCFYSSVFPCWSEGPV